ncbi:MAG TPA: ABC transporter ATP-binding protein [Candidatus Synoicihabitans sp.]|nr:ABC transporter ATP-binding protein [Candidatus Synoicihabitans sp.]
MLELSRVTKRYGPLTALEDISLRIEPGECFGLLGPNGAGKSTLMSLIAGLQAPDEGAIFLHGRALGPRDRESRRIVGLIPQHLALYEELTAEQNLRIFAQLHGLQGALLRERVEYALDVAQLTERRRASVKTFSGGMQRRLNLAAALLHQPRLLLCDEPTVGVDPQSRNAIFELLQRLCREGTTLIYSTHYMDEATRLCSRIGIIDHGRILALGTLGELLSALPFETGIRFSASTGTASLAAQLAAEGELITVGTTYLFRPRVETRLSEFYALTEAHELPPELFSIERPTLEALFLHLTGRELRE